MKKIVYEVRKRGTGWGIARQERRPDGTWTELDETWDKTVYPTRDKAIDTARQTAKNNSNKLNESKSGSVTIEVRVRKENGEFGHDSWSYPEINTKSKG